MASSSRIIKVGPIAGRYRITSILGDGGMGAVYRAWDQNLETEVVVKFPRRALLQESGFAERFADEVRSLVRLSHPHIVKVLDVGQHDGVPFCVLQFLQGGSLAARRRHAPDGRPIAEAPSSLQVWLPSIALALDFVHAQGYLHRDVKPGNILFDDHGHAYLSDFGIAKVLGTSKWAPGHRSLTSPDMVLGTPQFVAPELVMGEPADGRADQYALAVTVYELLAGSWPIVGPTPSAVLVQQTNQAPVPLNELVPGVTPEYSSAVLRGLAKRPHERYASCQDFATAVLAAVRALPAEAPPFWPQRLRQSKGSEGCVACPVCAKSLPLKEKYAGKRVRCPSCQTSLRVSSDRCELFEAPSPRAQAALHGQLAGDARDLGVRSPTIPPALAPIPTPSPAPVSGVQPGDHAKQPPHWARRNLLICAVAGCCLVAASALPLLPPLIVTSRTVPVDPPAWRAPEPEPKDPEQAAPTMAAIDSVRMDEGTSRELRVSLTQPELWQSGDLLYSLVEPYPDWASIDAHDGTIRLIPGERHGPGHYQVLVKAETPSAGAATTTLEIEVQEVNLPPIWNIQEEDRRVLLHVGERQELALSAMDPDLPSSDVSLSTRGSWPKWVTFDPSAETISIVPSVVGTAEVTLVAIEAPPSDMAAEITISITVTSWFSEHAQLIEIGSGLRIPDPIIAGRRTSDWLKRVSPPVDAGIKIRPAPRQRANGRPAGRRRNADLEDYVIDYLEDTLRFQSTNLASLVRSRSPAESPSKSNVDEADRAEAERVLSLVGPQDADVVAVLLLQANNACLRPLNQIGSVATPRIIEALSCPHPELREGAIWGARVTNLHQSNADVQGLLFRCLEDADMRIRIAAAGALLDTPCDQSAQTRVAHALAHLLGAPEHFSPEQGERPLNSSDVLVVWDMIAGMGAEARSALPILLEALSPLEDTPYAAMLLDCLQAIDPVDPRVITFEGRAVASTSWQGILHRVAIEGLVQVGPAALPVLPQLIECGTRHGLERSHLEVIEHIGPSAVSAVDVVRKAIRNSGRATQHAAIRACGAIGPGAAPAVPEILNRLEEYVGGVRSYIGIRLCLDTLARVGQSSIAARVAVKSLLHPMSTALPSSIRTAATETLDVLEGRRPIPPRPTETTTGEQQETSDLTVERQ